MLTKIKKLSVRARVEILKIKYEHVFATKSCKLKYMFFPNKTSDKLLVVFAGFPNVGRPARYNYIETFKDVDCNKLYILDNFGPDIRGGSYYLGKAKDFFVENTVVSLIDNISTKCKIEKRNIITAGSSKGGFASLYLSFKYGYGAVIAGAPQTLLGDYLSDHQTYFEYITGEYNNDNVKFLNSLLFDAVNNFSGEAPKIYLHVGRYEHHYEDHVMPFCDFLSEKNISFSLDVQDYNSHGQLGKFYPNFALRSLDSLMR